MKPNWFVAIPVPAGSWFEPLVRSVPPQVRVFHPEDVHLTVAFLGPVGAERAAAGWQQITSDHPAVEVSLGAVEPMGNPRRPSALSVIVADGFEVVADLVSALRDPILRAAEARPDTRPPKPHITVARPARNARGPARRAAIDWARARPSVGARVTLDRIALYTWAADRRERQFRIVEQHPAD